MKEDVMAKLDLLIGMSPEPSGPSARIDAAATRVSEQSKRVAAIRAALRRMLDDDSKAEQIARAFKGLLKR
ncbi:MAG TPA: hypothetical protein VEX87_04755 [Skermanella sp.]|nr:hypothetical protein [Skermanella sp.]